MDPPDPFAHRYNSLRLVGRGGIGAVYRAWDTGLDREVALKLLNANLATDPDWRRRFKQEATAASKLNHQNITIVHDRGEYEGRPFIVMEFVEGEPLSKIIEHQVSLTDPERLFLIEQLCDGLHYAHQRNIVHRDIKPVNLMVREEHDGTHMVRTLKILDFGVAKIVNAGQTATGGQLMFTPNYVSPEQIRGLEVDRRSDIFAVGAVAYELLVFQKAFTIRTTNPFAFLEEVKLRIVELPHRPMTDVRPDVDPELIAIVDRALQKAPENRYRDLAEMRRRIRAVRERLEEALARAGSSRTTVVLNPQLQEEVRLARESLKAAAPTAAVERLEQALASAPNQLVRRFIEEELEEARERQSAERAESKARDEQAAREAIVAATAAFEQGNGTAAILALEQFEPRVLVAEQIALLTRASALIQAADHAVTEGTRAEREAALRGLQEFSPRNLVNEVVTRLDQRAAERRAEEERARERDEAERAKQAIDAALDVFRQGDGAAAIRALEQFEPRELVAEEIALLTRAGALIQATEYAVTKGASAERAAALRELQGFSPRNLVSQAVSRLAQRAADRRAEEERAHERAEAERAKQAIRNAELEAEDRAAAQAADAPAQDAVDLAERQAADAKRVTALAVEQFLRGECETAIATLAAFQPAPLVEATLAELREAWRAIEQASHSVAEGDDETRQRAIEELRVFTLQALVESAAERLQQDHLERRAAEQRERERHEQEVLAAREEIAPALRDGRAAEPSTFARVVTRIRQAPVAVKAAAALLLLVLIVWSLYLFKPTSPPQAGPAPNYANELAAAQEAYSQGRTKDAIEKALLVYASPQGDPQTGAANLLRQIRAAAENDASAARGLADKAQATSETDYRDGVAKQSAAQAMDDPKGTEGAVALYGEAAHHYRRAATTAAQPADFMRQAMQEHDGGRAPRAIDYLQQALQRDAAYQPALDLLAKIRQQAESRAVAARAALKGTASNTTQFKDAGAKMRSAEKLTGVNDAPRQVQAYNEAEGLYKAAGKAARTAAAEAAKRHADAQEHLRLAQSALDARNFDLADTEIGKSLALEQSDEASALKEKVDDARRLAAIEARNLRIADLLERSKKAPNAEAVVLLSEALKLDPSRADVRSALDARKTSPPPLPRPSAVELETAAVRKTITDYVAAYNSMDVKRVQRLKPSFKSYQPFLRSTVLTISILDTRLSRDLQTGSVRLTVQYPEHLSEGHSWRDDEYRAADSHLAP